MVQEKLVELYDLIGDLAPHYGFEASLTLGRRKSDVAILYLKGDKTWVFAFYAKLIELMPSFELELFNIPDAENFGLVAAIIDPTVRDDSAMTERRLGLRRERLFEQL